MLKLFKEKSLKNNKNIKKQCGRSMVEMLGVLAIIGVLSIGGIQGYTLAMRKYQANEILNIANKYALLLYSNCQTAMQNDPKQYYIEKNYPVYFSSISGEYAVDLWNCPSPISFTDSGLGSLPNGAQSISWAYNMVSGKRGDVVGIRIDFDSNKLCQTTQSIVGVQASFVDDIKNFSETDKSAYLTEFTCEDTGTTAFVFFVVS